MAMQYETLDDLPDALRSNWPEKAQRVYLAAYRRTWEKCHNGGEQNDRKLHATAHDAALLAVRSQFRENELGAWHHENIGADK